MNIMIDKYQEALDLVKPDSQFDYDYLEDCLNKDEILKAYNTLQELIDEYELLIEKFQQQGNQYYNRIMYSVILEKALNKACELNIKQKFDRDYLYIPNDVIKQKEKELKDELLKESEK